MNNYRTILSIFILLLGFLQSSLSQNQDCLIKRQLLKIQSSNLSEINQFLSNEGWEFDGAQTNQQFSYWEYPLSYDQVKWAVRKNYFDNNIILFTKSYKSNIAILQTNSLCFKELQSEFSDTKVETVVDDNKLTSIYVLGNQTVEFRQYKSDYSSRQYSVLIYNQKELAAELSAIQALEEYEQQEQLRLQDQFRTILDSANQKFENENFEMALSLYSAAYEISPENYISNKMLLCNEGIYNKSFNLADKKLQAGEYDKAIDLFNKAEKLANACKDPSSKHSRIENKISLCKSRIHFQNGINYFEQKKYKEALNEFEKSNQFLENKEANEKIDQITKIQEIVKNRKTIFNYRALEPASFRGLQTSSLKYLNEIVESSNSGSLKLNLNISFDTLGKNDSEVKIQSSTIPWNTAQEAFYGYLISPLFKAPSKDGYYLSAVDILNVDLNWNKTRHTYSYKPKGITNNGNSKGSEAIRKYLVNNRVSGKYQFDVTSKVLGDKDFQDIELVKFSTRGPLNAVYSTLIPGLGSLRASYGSKGKGRMALFYIGFGTASLSTILSSIYYSEYLSDPNSSLGKSNYTTANNMNKLALIAAGITATVYVYDVFWAFGRGLKNVKDAKKINNQIKRGNPIIQSQSLSF